MTTVICLPSGRKIGASRAAITRSLFDNVATLDGYFVRCGRGVRIHKPSGEPIAYLANDGVTCFFVTCYRRYGKYWYMNACTRETRDFIGEPESYAESIAAANACFAQIDNQKVTP